MRQKNNWKIGKIVEVAFKRKTMKKLILFLGFLAFFSSSCNSLETKDQNRRSILNTLYKNYKSSKDSVAIFQYSFAYQENEFNFKSIKSSSYYSDVVSDIPTGELNIWENQLNEYTRKANWVEWGWNIPQFVSREDIPEYFSQEGPPPSEGVGQLKVVYYFSMPIVGKKYSFVKVGTKSPNSWSVNVVILKLENQKGWKIIGKRNVFTT